MEQCARFIVVSAPVFIIDVGEIVIYRRKNGEKKHEKEHKEKIAIRCCAGCYCKYDRRKIIKDLSEAFADSCEFEFSYDLEDDEKYDAALLISGCDSHCAKESELIKNIVIDHNNWERAEEIFAAEIEE